MGKRYLSYGIELNLSFICGKINVNADNEHVRKTYINAETLAKAAEHTLDETMEFIELENAYLIECLNMIIGNVKRSISAEFEDSGITCAKTTYPGAWILGNGDVLLYCHADAVIDIERSCLGNSTDKVVPLIENALEHTIDDNNISVSYKVLH